MGKTKSGDDKGKATVLSVMDKFAAMVENEDKPPKDPPTTPDDAEDDDVVADEVDDLSGDEDEIADDDATDDDDDVDPDDVDDDDDEDDDDEPDEDVLLFKVPGVEQEVSSDDLVKGYMMQEDYSRKTAALAQERDAFSETSQAVQKEREQYSTLLTELEQAIKTAVPKEPDWAALKIDNPTEYAQQREVWRDRNDTLAKIAQEKETVAQKHAEDFQVVLQKRVAEERDKLIEAVPEWKDAKVLTTGQVELSAYAIQVGFTTEELNEVVDHRAIVLLRKAMLYDQLQGTKPIVQKKAKKAPVIKPGAPKRTPSKKKGKQIQRAREQLKKSGTQDDAANAFYAHLMEE